MGKEYDPNFLFEISFGFMPRQFKPTAEDRYMFEEEIDVTEIYFILKGTFAVAFNSFNQSIDRSLAEEVYEEQELKAPLDMKRKGHIIASLF